MGTICLIEKKDKKLCWAEQDEMWVEDLYSCVWKTCLALWYWYIQLRGSPRDVCIGGGREDSNFGKKAQNSGKIVEDTKAKRWETKKTET